MISREAALRDVELFQPEGDDLAVKSRDLVLGLLTHTPSPFSRDQFTPGHITCTALVFHPTEPSVLLMFHHRLERWLLPGGHVEADDADLRASAAREAEEETLVKLAQPLLPGMAGIDVHFIPPKRNEPFHLHHDLLWAFRAADSHIETTAEAPQVCWAGANDWDRYHLAENIQRSARRVLQCL
jgi:8-oxo-dGTP pyrophosphatase MutT (NUDIX family)